MALALNRESFFWHKVHSLTGIVPVGFYMLQHLTLNSFSVAGERQFNGVLNFFESIPWYVLLAMEIFLIWLPLLFHAIYGIFIVNRARVNYFGAKYGWSQNAMYTFQRVTGLILFFFLIYHVITTTVLKYRTGSLNPIGFQAWHDKLTSYGYIFLIIYMIGVFCASYHLAFGVWNFCIRWGITISERAQLKVQKFAVGMCVVVTLLGWVALLGFLMPHNTGSSDLLPDKAPVSGSTDI